MVELYSSLYRGFDIIVVLRDHPHERRSYTNQHISSPSIPTHKSEGHVTRDRERTRICEQNRDMRREERGGEGKASAEIQKEGRTGYDDGRYHRPKKPRGPIHKYLRPKMAEREQIREQRQIIHPAHSHTSIPLDYAARPEQEHALLIPNMIRRINPYQPARQRPHAERACLQPRNRFVRLQSVVEFSGKV